MLRDQEKNKHNQHHRIHTKPKMKMSWTYSKNEGQQVDQTLHRVATKEREEIKRTTKQKIASRYSKEGVNHLEQESNRQKTMEGFDGQLHPAVDGQSRSEDKHLTIFKRFSTNLCIIFKRLEGSIHVYRLYQTPADMNERLF